MVGQLFVQSVQQALSPHLSALFAKDQKAAATSIYQAATLWSMIAAWPLYLVLAGFAPALMAVFGEGYEVASDVVLILSLTMLLATACGPVDSVLLMAGRSWLSLRNSTVALAVNIGLNVVLIPAQGIRGAAISWAVAIVVRNLLPLLIVGRHLHMWPVTKAAVQVAVGAVLCFGVVDVVAALTEVPQAGRPRTRVRRDAGLPERGLVGARQARSQRVQVSAAAQAWPGTDPRPGDRTGGRRGALGVGPVPPTLTSTRVVSPGRR